MEGWGYGRRLGLSEEEEEVEEERGARLLLRVAIGRREGVVRDG